MNITCNVPMLCVLTSERMLGHGFAWLKMIKNISQKMMKKVPFCSCTQEAHVKEEKSLLVSDYE